MKKGGFGILKSLLSAFACGSAVFAGAGFSASQVPALPVAPDPTIESVHQGDVIEIDVIGSIEYDWRGTLDPEGNLAGYDVIEDKVFARCRSVDEIAKAVGERLSGTLRDPRVAVRILDSAGRFPAVVEGAVAQPTRFLFRRPARLIELIVLAGGLTEDGSGSIVITRAPGRGCIQAASAETEYIRVSVGDLLAGKANPPITFGDLVTLVGARPVYVLGGVANPGRLFVRSEMTLSRAVAMAGDLTRDAQPERITVFRRSAEGQALIEADLLKIRAGTAEDPILKPFDVVDVPVKGRSAPRLPPADPADTAAGDTQRLPLRVIE